MVKRRTTYAFSSIVLGRYCYSLAEKKPVVLERIRKLLEETTVEEKTLISFGNFEILYYAVFLKKYSDLDTQFDRGNYARYKKKFDIFFTNLNPHELSSIAPIWDFPKGKQDDSHEPSIETAKREFEEETGILAYRMLECEPLIITFRADVEYRYILYFAVIDAGAQMHFRPNGEVSEISWFSAERSKFILRNEFKPFVRKIIKTAKKNRVWL